MDADALLAAIEDDHETELSRLGSSKALYAATAGDIETEPVLSALAGRMGAAATTFEAWGDGPDGTFAAAGETARDAADRLASLDDAVEPADDPSPLDDSLRGLDGTAERLGGLIAWAMVTDRTLSQAVGFFVGSADPGSADTVRDLRGEIDGVCDRALDALDTLDDAEGAREAAAAAIEAAYADYASTLEGMGIKVKPVC